VRRERGDLTNILYKRAPAGGGQEETVYEKLHFYEDIIFVAENTGLLKNKYSEVYRIKFYCY